jgi:glycerol uptake facilitator-like aquaporin
MLIYIIAPMVGGFIAAYAFHFHNENTKQRE